MNTPQIDDGGPAFPHSSQPLDACGNPMCGEHSEWGMALRDWFAGMALTSGIHGAQGDAKNQEHAAATAYRLADAMIAARKPQP